MPAPTNTTPDTAIDITSPPYSVVLDVSAAPTGTDYMPSCVSDQFAAVWWKYTAVACDAAIAVLAIQNSAGTYNPALSVWTGTIPSLTELSQFDGSSDVPWCASQAPDKWFEIPVIPGITYYFQVNADSATTPDVSLHFQLHRAPKVTVNPGTVLVPNDTPGWPAIIFEPDGTLDRVITFPACEAGTNLPDNRACVAAEIGPLAAHPFKQGAYVIFDPQLNHVSTVTSIVIDQQDQFAPVSSNRLDTFYVGITDGILPAVIKTISTTGVVGGTSWTLPASSKDIEAMAISLDETRLYWTSERVVGGLGIQAYDLVNDVALSPIIAPDTFSWGRDILMLQDGTMLAVYRKSLSVKHFDNTGTVLHTFTLPVSAGAVVARIAVGIDDPDSFWSMTFPDANHTRLQHVKISDSSILDDFTVPQRDAGLFGGVGDVQFGPAQSCPLLTMTDTITVSDSCQEVSGSIIVTKITSPADSPEQFTFHAGGGVSPTDFTLGDGDTQTLAGVVPGSGYSVLEDPVDSWSTLVTVSNGSPSTNITVADGEEVLVTFTNALSQTFPLIRERIFALVPPYNQMINQFISRIEILGQPGTGNADATAPTLTISLSKDGGQTYVITRTVGIGEANEYLTRWYSMNWGKARNPVVKLCTSDPVFIGLLECYVDSDAGVH